MAEKFCQSFGFLLCTFKAYKRFKDFRQFTPFNFCSVNYEAVCKTAPATLGMVKLNGITPFVRDSPHGNLDSYKFDLIAKPHFTFFWQYLLDLIFSY